MKFRNKKTGEIRTLYNDYKDGKIHLAGESDLLGKLCYDSLKGLCEDWEDAPEEKKYGGRVPKGGDEYWFITSEGKLCRDYIATGYDTICTTDAHRFESGSAFWTREEAEKELARRKAYVILKEDTKGYKPDWGKRSEEKWYVLYRHNAGNFVLDWRVANNDGEKLYFATKEDAEASIEAHCQQWLDYLGIKEEK